MENIKSETEDKKLYARLFKSEEHKNIKKSELKFFPCDYILRGVDGVFGNKQCRLKNLGEKIIIGSEEEGTNILLKDDEVSPKHCMLEYVNNTFYYKLTDLESKTGTWIRLHNLEDGYEIIEDTQFQLFQYSLFVKFENNSKDIYLEIIKGTKKMTSLKLEDNKISIGKNTSDIILQLDCIEDLRYSLNKYNNKIIMVNETSEITDKGMFMKLKKNFFLIKAGDVIKIGRTIFRIIAQNWGTFTEYGDRPTQEDKFCIVDDLRIFEDIIVPFYAVYDGHGGVTCSEFLRKNFHKYLHYSLRDKQYNLNDSKNFIDDFIKIVQDTIIIIDLHYYQYEKNFSVYHGSTCVANFYLGNIVLCLNLGDSLSILMKKNEQKVFLSRDLKPTRKDELNRIEKKGGFVSNDGRLLGSIAVSRAFGDWKFKDKEKYHLLKLNNYNSFKEYLISNRAEFRIFSLSQKEDSFIILASDGIFQFLSYSQIFSMINKYLISQEENKQFHLKNIPKIVDLIRYDILVEAKSEGNRENADNMTFIMIEI